MTGRNEEDVFPTFFRANTTSRLHRLAESVGLRVVSLDLLREHPHYVQFSSLLYVLASIYEQVFQRYIRQLRPQILGVLQRPRL